ncbi:MAG TPA: hypothetical protein PKA37_08325, partial [Planctomycetota bacterium]|nr:hypothetical protein [Planctomycetota bacterium]
MSEFYVQEERFPVANRVVATGCLHLSRASGPHPLELLHFQGGQTCRSLPQWHRGPRAALARALCRAGCGSFQAVTHSGANEADLLLASFRAATCDPRVSRLRLGLTFFGDPPGDLPRVLPALRAHREPRGVVLVAPRSEIPWSSFRGLRVCVLSSDPCAANEHRAR